MKLTEQTPWWQTAVIYQIYPRSYRDTTGNGVGDLAGVIEKLPYLSDTLGVEAIWLSPFYPSPMADFGYDVSDYTDVHPLFGDLRTFSRLVNEAHDRDLKIIIDLVPNHSSDQHAWFLESRASRDNPKRDWYVWADPRPDGSPPNNWLSVFGGPAWEWDELTRQYYLHSFLKEQPDLNWRNPEVKAAMWDVVRFWMERGVDGFRIDVAHYIMKDPLMRDNPANDSLQQVVHKPLGEYDAQEHLFDKGHEDVHEVYRELRTVVDSFDADREIVTIGEIHIFDLNEWSKYYGANLDELHMPFNFSLLKAEWNAQSVKQSVDDLEAALPPGAWPNYVLGNHDETRLATRFGKAQARIAAMLLLTLRGTPTLYYGDEIGMTEVDVPEDQQQDPWGMRVPGLGRDGCRTPMQWNSGKNVGFSSPETKGLWLPLTDDYETTNVKEELADQKSILTLYQQLIQYRHNHPTLQDGNYKLVIHKTADCFVYTRSSSSNKTLLIALNFSAEDQRLRLQQFNSGFVALSTWLDRTGSIDLADFTLRADEGLIIEIYRN